jgi:predicted nuclease of predicted toxin-antitoxin system
VKFLVDANLPRALVAWLSEEGADAQYVDDLLTPPAADDDIWNLAVAGRYVVVSKDADFASRATRDPAVRVVWIRCGNLKLTASKEWFSTRSGAMRGLLQIDSEDVIELR